jgi:hypothetical protein
MTDHVADMLTVLLIGCALSAAATEAMQSPVLTINISSPVSTPVQVENNTCNPCVSMLPAFLHAGMHRQCMLIPLCWVAAAV